jgi:hypothetical protein
VASLLNFFLHSLQYRLLVLEDVFVHVAAAVDDGEGLVVSAIPELTVDRSIKERW